MPEMDAMFEQFGDDARDVMIQAESEASRLNHDYLGTEHILLGLTRGTGAAVDILKNLKVSLREIRRDVEKIIRSMARTGETGDVPFTPRAKKAIESALEEAHILNCKFVGREHILLGLLRDPSSVAFQVLTNLGLAIEEVRKQALVLTGDSRKPL
jgi:ATP-dependent Clp protease ATP-binding subunit ClpC